MRWLTKRLRIMVFNPRSGDLETGAVTVLTAVLTVVLLLMVAMVVDTGLLYAEKAQLQSGADAAALAAANCSSQKPACSASAAQTLAGGLVNQNSNDNASNLTGLDFSVAGQVTSTTSTLSDGNSFLTMPFAGITGQSQAKLTATATATWGSISAGTAVLPFTFGACQVDLGATDTAILLHSDSKVKKCGAWNPSSGLNGPGGFGYLSPDANCQVTVSVYGVAPSDSGNSMPNGCDGVLDANLGKTVLLPIFSAYISKPKSYQIAGWGAFVLTGYNLPANKPNKSAGIWTGGNGTGLEGHFVKVLTYEEGFTYGAPPDKFGNANVHLTK